MPGHPGRSPGAAAKGGGGAEPARSLPASPSAVHSCRKHIISDRTTLLLGILLPFLQMRKPRVRETEAQEEAEPGLSAALSSLIAST